MSKVHSPQSVEVWRPSELVGLNVRHWRERRGWSQQRLVNRLNELLTESPPWAERLYEARQEDPTRPQDSRERNPHVKRANSAWNQAKLSRLEAGKVGKVKIEDVFELALALDVSPLHLIARAQGEDGAPLRIRLAPTKWAWSHAVKQWIRGARPLTSLGDYKTDDEAAAGHRFYLIESQPLGEWALIEEAAKYAGRVRQSLDLLTPSGEEAPDGE